MKHVLSLQRVSVRLFSAIAVLATMVMACDDEETINPVDIQFTGANLTVSEAAGEQTVNLTFTSAAPADATVEINIENSNVEYGTDYTTNPNGSSGKVTIAITKGQTSAQFKFTPVNNNLLSDQIKTVTFSVGTITGPIESETSASFIVTITDDEGPSTINFETSSSNTAEGNAAGLDINLPLSAVAPGTSQVVVNIASENAVYGTHYTTAPAAVDGKVTLQIAVGDAAKLIKVLPVDNANVNAARVLTFTIESATTAVQVGTNVTHTFTINDDETPSTVAFATAEGSMSEGLTEGVNVVVNLTPVANAAGTLEISFTSTTAVYGTNFTTEPAAVEGKITLNIESGAGSTSFKIIPVEDTNENDSRVINFAMTASTGIVIFESGVANTLYSHTITDNDAVTSIADVRALYQGANLDITSSLRIRGIVTSSNPQVNTNNIWVQDATAGIVVRFATANNNAIKRGDEVVVELNGGQFTAFMGLLQVQNVPNANATVIDENNTLPTPQVISIAEFNTGNYEGKLVRINDVGFVDADGILTMSGSRTISDGTNTTVVRTESGVSFGSSVMPYGIGAVTGLAGDFNAAQIIPIVFEEDIFVSNAIGSITTTGTLNDFGSVNKDAESTSQQYTVQGTGLSKDIIVSASANFKVSLDNTTFTTSVTIPAASANSVTTVYVKFAPTTAVNQALEGTITHKSLGTTPTIVNVTGTESGNAGASTLILNEQFNYSTGQLTSVNSGANVSGGTWVNFSGTSNVINVVSGSLSYTGYVPATGNSVRLINGSAEDAYTAFASEVTSGKVYIAFLVNVTSTTGLPANTSTTGDYFAGFLPSTSTTTFSARVSIRTGSVAGTYNLGLRATSANAASVFKSSDYATGETRLVVISYEMVDGSTNDIMSIWIDPTLGGSEPSADLTQVGAAADLANLARFFLRQGTNAVNADIDGIRVAKNWADLFN